MSKLRLGFFRPSIRRLCSWTDAVSVRQGESANTTGGKILASVDEFVDRHIGSRQQQVEEMLKVCGVLVRMIVMCLVLRVSWL